MSHLCDSFFMRSCSPLDPLNEAGGRGRDKKGQKDWSRVPIPLSTSGGWMLVCPCALSIWELALVGHLIFPLNPKRSYSLILALPTDGYKPEVALLQTYPCSFAPLPLVRSVWAAGILPRSGSTTWIFGWIQWPFPSFSLSKWRGEFFLFPTIGSLEKQRSGAEALNMSLSMRRSGGLFAILILRNLDHSLKATHELSSSLNLILK